MHVVIATMSHETNTFSPVITDLDRFSGGRDVPLEGEDAPGASTVAPPAVVAVIFRRRKKPLRASPFRSSPLHRHRGRWTMTRTNTSSNQSSPRVTSGCDALMLDLHGAMVTRSLEDGEGELLAPLRRLCAGSADRRRARHACESVSGDRRARNADSRLSHLSPHRHGRHRAAGGACCCSTPLPVM